MILLGFLRFLLCVDLVLSSKNKRLLHGVKDRNLYEVMRQSMSARRQPLLIMITTAGTVRECIFDDMYNYAAQVADGTIADPHFLPVLYELDDRSEWTDPAAWVKANPAEPSRR